MGFFDFFKGSKDKEKDKEQVKEQKESLDSGLKKTRDSFFSRLTAAVIGKSTVDEAVLDDLEDILVAADVGVFTTLKIIKAIEARVARDKYVNTSELDIILREEIINLLGAKSEYDADSFSVEKGMPYVMMVVGVNGVGKTTTIGKLASQFHNAGKKVVLGAADTFRAAAVEQLVLWGARTGVPVINRGMNTDPAGVAFDAVKHAVEIGADVVIIDTAGRLHNKVNLMNELSKIKRVMQKVIPDAPHEVLLVLDGSTGQNAMTQAEEFTKATEVTALAITKLDGTAKGGVVIGISDKLSIPVKYIGVGEKITDLQLFDKKDFVESLFSKL
ncbi:MAG: signal recognition particle-docking protein FtsY [Bacteroidota bacterium]